MGQPILGRADRSLRRTGRLTSGPFAGCEIGTLVPWKRGCPLFDFLIGGQIEERTGKLGIIAYRQWLLYEGRNKYVLWCVNVAVTFLRCHCKIKHNLEKILGEDLLWLNLLCTIKNIRRHLSLNYVAKKGITSGLVKACFCDHTPLRSRLRKVAPCLATYNRSRSGCARFIMDVVPDDRRLM